MISLRETARVIGYVVAAYALLAVCSVGFCLLVHLMGVVDRALHR